MGRYTPQVHCIVFCNVDSFTTHIVVIDGKKIVLQIWDTSGQERYRILIPMYYRNAMVSWRYGEGKLSNVLVNKLFV